MPWCQKLSRPGKCRKRLAFRRHPFIRISVKEKLDRQTERKAKIINRKTML